MNTGRFTYRLGTFIIPRVVLIETGLLLLPSCQPPKVRDVGRAVGVASVDRILAEKEYRDSDAYRKFRRQLFCESLFQIFRSIRNAMISPIVLRCPDGKYRRGIFTLGPYIADYPEQCIIASVVQGWCPK